MPDVKLSERAAGLVAAWLLAADAGLEHLATGFGFTEGHECGWKFRLKTLVAGSPVSYMTA